MRLRSLFILLLLPVGFTQAQETRQLSAEAETLLQCFHEIYGEKIISGCTANVNWNINEAKWVYQHTGKWPANKPFVASGVAFNRIGREL